MTKPRTAAPRRRFGAGSFALAAMLGAILALGIGFLVFADSVRRLAPPDPAPQVDGIVALTGGSRGRLDAAVALLNEGAGERLLISGVNRNLSDAEVAAAFEMPPALAECCIDFGRQAEDTLGNAAETAAWARTHGFERLLIVTDDFHMPRSLAELRIALPGVTLVAYPVETRSSRPRVWLREPAAANRLIVEYGKYLVVRLREGVIALLGGARDQGETGP